jgi:hypothetical protein
VLVTLHRGLQLVVSKGIRILVTVNIIFSVVWYLYWILKGHMKRSEFGHVEIRGDHAILDIL